MWELRRALQRNDPVPGTAGRICDIPYDDTGLVCTPKTNLTTSGGRANNSRDKNVQNMCNCSETRVLQTVNNDARFLVVRSEDRAHLLGGYLRRRAAQRRRPHYSEPPRH